MPAIEGTTVSEEKLGGSGKVRNKIGTDQRKERGYFNRGKEADAVCRAERFGFQGNVLLSLLETKDKQCPFVGVFVSLTFNTRGKSFAMAALGCFHFACSVLGKRDWGGTRKSSTNKLDLGGRQDARDIKKG